MKITSIESFLLGDKVTMVRVRTDDGAEGIGQTAPYQADVTRHLLHRLVAPAFLGTDPWDVEVIGARFLEQQYKFDGSFLCRALAGIDTAIWDLLARSVGVPVYKLIGGADKSSFSVYGSSMRRDISPEAEAERLAALRDSHGFGAFKIRIGDGLGRDRDAASGRTDRIIAHTREVLGDGVALMADANGAYTLPNAVQVGRRLEQYGFVHYEEPVVFWERELTGEVARQLTIPVAAGEQEHSLTDIRRLVATPHVDIVQPDIGYLGGISRSRQAARIAEAHAIPCTPHCANASMLQVFSAHLALAMPSITQRQEWSIEDDVWTRELYVPVLTVSGGEVSVPDAPGWGVEVHPRVIEQGDHQVSRLTDH